MSLSFRRVIGAFGTLRFETLEQHTNLMVVVGGHFEPVCVIVFEFDRHLPAAARAICRGSTLLSKDFGQYRRFNVQHSFW